MADSDVILANDATPTASRFDVKNVSWGAVFGGFVMALVVHLGLMLLGLGIGASTIDPLAEQNPLNGIGIGTGIWFAVVTLIALYTGGWVAGRLSGLHRKVDGSLHGLLAWGVSSLVVAFMVSSAITTVVGGTAAMVGQGAQALGRGVANAGSTVAGLVESQLGQAGINISSIRTEVSDMLARNGGQAMQSELFAVLDNAFMDDTPMMLEPEDKQAISSFMMTRMNMSEGEVTVMINRWEQNVETAQAKFADAQVAVERQAREAADAVAAGVSRAALWSFVAMLLGGIAAAFGGMNGATKGDFATERVARRKEVVGRPVYQS